jgi:DNA-binding response OmpR family regulator
MQGRIMVVDDTLEILEVMRWLLTDAGYRVATYSAVAVAIAALSKQSPDLIIVDWLFGDAPLGADLVGHVKADTAMAHLPIIVCTAYPQEVAESGLLELPSVSLLCKPYEFEELQAAVATALKDG